MCASSSLDLGISSEEARSSRPTPLPTVLHMDALSPLYVEKKGSAAENHSHEKSLPEPKYGPGPSQDACWCPCFPAIRPREVSPLSPQTLGSSTPLFFVFVELLIP